MISERYDDADVLQEAWRFLVVVYKAFYDFGNNGSFFIVGFCVARHDGRLHVDEHHSFCVYQLGKTVVRRARGKRTLLVGQGDSLQASLVECVIDEIAYIGVHPPLSVEHTDDFILPVCAGKSMETLEKGVAHVSEPDGVQTGAPGDGLARLQEHHGGQLFVVANHDKFSNGRSVPARLWHTVNRGFVAQALARLRR